MTATRIVQTFGSDTYDVLNSQPAVTQLQRVPKIGKIIAENIKIEWDKDTGNDCDVHNNGSATLTRLRHFKGNP